MNGNYYQNPTFPTNDEVYNNGGYQNLNDDSSQIYEQSFIENILRLNKGKKVKVYVSYPDSLNWKDKIYNGIIEQAGTDHIIISDPSTGMWYLIRLIYLDYIEFDEKINYKYNI